MPIVQTVAHVLSACPSMKNSRAPITPRTVYRTAKGASLVTHVQRIKTVAECEAMPRSVSQIDAYLVGREPGKVVPMRRPSVAMISCAVPAEMMENAGTSPSALTPSWSRAVKQETCPALASVNVKIARLPIWARWCNAPMS